jgi:hypothetical protein
MDIPCCSKEYSKVILLASFKTGGKWASNLFKMVELKHVAS